VPETSNGFLNLKTSLPTSSASILTVIVHSAAWSLVEMGMYLSVVINFSTLP
jgi:hypothetical protein